MHAEAMLLIDHHEAEIAEGDALLKDRMGADEDIDVAFLQRPNETRALAAALASRQQGDA